MCYENLCMTVEDMFGNRNCVEHCMGHTIPVVILFSRFYILYCLGFILSCLLSLFYVINQEFIRDPLL